MPLAVDDAVEWSVEFESDADGFGVAHYVELGDVVVVMMAFIVIVVVIGVAQRRQRVHLGLEIWTPTLTKDHLKQHSHSSNNLTFVLDVIYIDNCFKEEQQL